MPSDQTQSGEADRSAPCVSEILINQAAFDNEDPRQIVQANIEFANALMDKGAYLPDELPVNAMRSYHVDYYMVQVENGGHGQFVGNSRWAKITIRNISAGLRAMGANSYTDIFDDLKRLIESDHERAGKIAASFGFGEKEPAIKELDERFFALTPRDGTRRNTALLVANAQWLRSLPELTVIPDDAYLKKIKGLIDANPLREQRLAERRGKSLQLALIDPFTVASRLLCAKAQCLPVVAVGAGDPALTAPDGRKGTGWRITTGKGNRVVFLFDDVAFLCSLQLKDGTLITPELLSTQEQKLASGDFSDLERWAELKSIEVARIDQAEVSDAIQSARKWPVLKMAEALLEKLQQGDELKSVFAYTKHESGHWIWAMETDKRIATFGRTPDGVGLFDTAMKPLVTLDHEEVRALMPGSIGVVKTGLTRAEANGPRQANVNTSKVGRDDRRDGGASTHLAMGMRRLGRFGFLLSIALLFLYNFSLMSLAGKIGLSVVLLLEAYGIVQLRRQTTSLKNSLAARKTPILEWLANELSLSRLALYLGLGFFSGFMLIGVAVGSTDVFELIYGKVPTFQLYKFKISYSLFVILTALAPLVLFYFSGTKLWARRRYAAWENSQTKH